VRSPNAVTLVGIHDERNVQVCTQITFRFLLLPRCRRSLLPRTQVIGIENRTCLDLLMDFDLDCAAFAFDGETVRFPP
jgi:hypothetical protein